MIPTKHDDSFVIRHVGILEEQVLSFWSEDPRANTYSRSKVTR